MKRAVYPGSFDPVTLGHYDIIKRASAMTDELILGVGTNKAKNPLFSVDERVNMLQVVCKEFANVTVKPFSGLLVDFALSQGADAIIRGLRVMTDFEFELMNAQTNRVLNSSVETIFLITDPAYSYISSTGVRELGAFGADIKNFVPESVYDCIKARFDEIHDK